MVGRPRSRAKDNHDKKDRTNRRNTAGMIQASHLNPLWSPDIGSGRYHSTTSNSTGGHDMFENSQKCPIRAGPLFLLLLKEHCLAAWDGLDGTFQIAGKAEPVSKSTAGCRGRVSGHVARNER